MSVDVTMHSMLSGKAHTRTIPISEEKFKKWLQIKETPLRPHIQDFFPELNADDREFLKTGITPEEWNETFPEEEDEGYLDPCNHEYIRKSFAERGKPYACMTCGHNMTIEEARTYNKDQVAPVPNPGHQDAKALGCLCPAIDNGHGKGYMGGMKNEKGETMFVRVLECPVHDQDWADQHYSKIGENKEQAIESGFIPEGKVIKDENGQSIRYGMGG